MRRPSGEISGSSPLCPGFPGAINAVRGEETAVDVVGQGRKAEVLLGAVGVLGNDGRLFVSGRTQPGEFQGHGFLRAFGTNIRALVWCFHP